MKRVNQSGIWDHMEKVSHGKVRCNLCSKQLAYSQGDSTTSLMHHLKAMHSDITDPRPAGRKEQPSLLSFGTGLQCPCSESCQEKLTMLFTKFVVANTLSVSLIQSDEMRETLAFLEPNYTVFRKNTTLCFLL